ncbi:MAG: serine hydrolase domain-containing protein, partial [Thermoanaerobaculia bacterium]
ASDVTIRQVLSMTSGYQDFWPQDYVMPPMLQPVTAHEIMTGWAKKPLDFEPGTKWQYSNTNYVIAGQIVERVIGMPLLDFLQKRVFGPLQMTSVTNTDEAGLGPEDPARYMRFGLASPRPAPKEGKGWMFAAGELAMTASDLAKWDISMIDQTVLKPASYRELEREIPLANGVGSRYGLGVSLSLVDGRRLVSHGGEVSGFTAQNQVYPDDRAAVVVLTNLDASGAPSQIATKISSMLFAPATSKDALDQAKKIFAGLQKGQLERTLFTSNANAYFSDAALKDFASSLGPLGTPREFTQSRQSLRGGMTSRNYRVVFPKKTLRVWTFTMPDGKLEQYMVAVAE